MYGVDGVSDKSAKYSYVLHKMERVKPRVKENVPGINSMVFT